MQHKKSKARPAPEDTSLGISVNAFISNDIESVNDILFLLMKLERCYTSNYIFHLPLFESGS